MSAGVAEPSMASVARRQRVIAILIIGVLHLGGWGGLALSGWVSFRGGESWANVLVLGATAYALGLRHAFDADHIAAIDNTNRRFATLGQPSTSVGLWFSLGHSTVVVVAAAVLVLGFGELDAASLQPEAGIRHAGAAAGLAVSGVFLVLIGVVNFVPLLRTGHGLSHVAPRALLSGRIRGIRRPWQMYIVGLLFSLGLDTASEIVLLSLAGTALFGSGALVAVMMLPVLFAAGMTLLDTAQGAVMRSAIDRSRSSATATPHYGTWITCVSAGMAIVIGLVQLCQLFGSVQSASAPVAWLAGLDISSLGIALTVVAVVTLLAVALHERLAR